MIYVDDKMNSELLQADMKWWPMIYCNCDSIQKSVSAILAKYGRSKNV